MTEFLKQILTSQFEASLAMMNQRVSVCPEKYWDGKIGADTFRQTAYHSLFYFDLYLSLSEDDFQLSELNIKGGDDRGTGLCPGLSKADTLQYVTFCKEKIYRILNVETEETLRGDSGFSWRKHSRGELHFYNIRHFQHHVGQLSTYLRRVSDENKLSLELPWVGMGWKVYDSDGAPITV